MALLVPIIDTGLGEPMPDAFAKINEAINTINDVLGGGAIGDSIRKVSANDFDFEFVPTLKQKTIVINDWDMDADEIKVVAHGLLLSKMRTIDVSIMNVAGTQLSPLSILAQFLNDLPSGGFFANATDIAMYRNNGGVFDSSGYSGGGLRGYIIINYVD